MSESQDFGHEARPNDRKAIDPEAFTIFIDDRWLAGQTRLKPETFRAQRFKRLHGLDHWFDLDPIYIGSKPRYRLSEALDWLERQSRNRQRIHASGQEAA